MTNANFANRLNSALDMSGTEAFMQAFDSLRQVAVNLTLWLRGTSVEGKVLAQVEPGFPAKLGQQFNLVIRIPDQKIADTLFRAYVDPQGQISLDFFGDEPVVCHDETELENRVLEFLDRPEVKTRMTVYKKLAT